MTRALRISERAEADLRAIWHWTFETFGPTQADRYLDELDHGMRTCGAAPEGGRDRSELRTGYRSLLARSHVIFYTFTDDEVVIRRVLHGSMEPGSHLSQ